MDNTVLKNGVSMPMLGFGVLQIKDPAKCRRCVREALEAGYRMFDTAAAYENEEAVGAALKEAMEEGMVKREELFVITKLWLKDAGEATAEKAFDASRKRLELHPFYQQERALATMKELGVQPQAWGPLCEGLRNIFRNKILEKTGKKYGKTAAQTALRWNLDRGVSVLTRSTKAEHMKEDFALWDFQLTEADRKTISGLDLGHSEILDYQNPCIARMFNR